MHLTTNDSRNLGVVLVDPSNGQCFNWVTGNYETFNASAHVRTINTISGLPPVFSTLKTAYLGTELLNRPDVVASIVTLDNSGNVLLSNDVYTSPFSLPLGIVGGISR